MKRFYYAVVFCWGTPDEQWCSGIETFDGALDVVQSVMNEFGYGDCCTILEVDADTRAARKIWGEDYHCHQDENRCDEIFCWE